ncbi:formin-like protein 17 [Cucumis melo]|uniref:Formin-like protein 17 n=1 Tax=Cucumis melo TaxID=3656 RepID=A0ABM3L937_CUCME|nr:formin-like protein 17 [Cucumis melo]
MALAFPTEAYSSASIQSISGFGTDTPFTVIIGVFCTNCGDHSQCSVLALDESALDVDQVDNLIKFCPTKEEMELLKGYNGDKDNLGKCEQFFLELMKVPRVESKLRVFSFKIQFRLQASDLRNSLNTINAASEEKFGKVEKGNANYPFIG